MTDLYNNNKEFFEKLYNKYVLQTNDVLDKWKKDYQKAKDEVGYYPGVVVNVILDFEKSKLIGYTNLIDLYETCSLVFNLNINHKYFIRNTTPYIKVEDARHYVDYRKIPFNGDFESFKYYKEEKIGIWIMQDYLDANPNWDCRLAEKNEPPVITTQETTVDKYDWKNWSPLKKALMLPFIVLCAPFGLILLIGWLIAINSGKGGWR